LTSTPTVGAQVDLCTALETNGDHVGTMYTITGTLANPMVATTSGAVPSQTPVVVAPGFIDLHCAATNTGAIKWTIIYEPIMASATVSAS